MSRFQLGSSGAGVIAPYTVFVDESFDGFPGLSKPDGYFCYAALMVPTSRLPDLERFWEASRKRLTKDYADATGFDLGNTEFKSAYLKKLQLSARKDFGERLSYFLRKNRCFVGGFYTTVNSFALYHLRTEIGKDDNAQRLPKDWESRLADTKSFLLQNEEHVPGIAPLLMGLLHLTLQITLNWLGSQGHSFEVVYDPRERKEDAFLLNYVTEWLSEKKLSVKRFPGVFRGATAKTPSHSSCGLMLTDLILRDLRFLFQDVPSLTEEASTTELILPIEQVDPPLIMTIRGSPFKAGAIRAMSIETARGFKEPSLNSMMPLYLERLADIKLSCHAKYGELRTVNFHERIFEDMLD